MDEEGNFKEVKSHPIAEVLSPSARIHWWGLEASSISSQTLTTIPRNSRRLFIFG
jgi:hypothetical protein